MNNTISFGLIVICILIAAVAGVMGNASSNDLSNVVNQSIKNSSSTNVDSSFITPITLSQGSSHKTNNNNNFTTNTTPSTLKIMNNNNNNNTIAVKRNYEVLGYKEKLTNNELAQTIADLKP